MSSRNKSTEMQAAEVSTSSQPCIKPHVGGRAVVAKMIIEWAKKGAEITNGKYGKMCSSCAFKKGTEANNDEIVIDAANCVAGSPHPFHCHELELNKCRGYLYAMEVS